MGFCSANEPTKGLACLKTYSIPKKDLFGYVYLKALYSERKKAALLMQYMNPEHKEVMANLPSVIMPTISADFRKHYTLSYVQALKKLGHSVNLLDYSADKHLIHAFPALNLFIHESADTMSRILAWFFMRSSQLIHCNGFSFTTTRIVH